VVGARGTLPIQNNRCLHNAQMLEPARESRYSPVLRIDRAQGFAGTSYRPGHNAMTFSTDVIAE
jgi:hypothetical protein